MCIYVFFKFAHDLWHLLSVFEQESSSTVTLKRSATMMTESFNLFLFVCPHFVSTFFSAS